MKFRKATFAPKMCDHDLNEFPQFWGPFVLGLKRRGGTREKKKQLLRMTLLSGKGIMRTHILVVEVNRIGN